MTITPERRAGIRKQAEQYPDLYTDDLDLLTALEEAEGENARLRMVEQDKELYSKTIDELREENERLRVEMSEVDVDKYHPEFGDVWRQSEGTIASLRAQLEKADLKWQTDKPPMDGWYWVQWRRCDDPTRWMKPNIERICLSIFDRYGCRWAGPIEPPKEPA